MAYDICFCTDFVPHTVRYVGCNTATHRTAMNADTRCVVSHLCMRTVQF
jgi:hypothetical protein